eukprot:gene12941-13069_t
MAEPNSAEFEDEFEEVEEYEDGDEGEFLGDDEVEDDPDFTPGDAEDEDNFDEDDDEQLEAISDTNAPYAEAAAASKGKRRGLRLVNPLKLLGALRPRRLVALVQGQRKTVQQLVWRLEDASVFTAKFAVKAAIKGARPILVWMIVARALRTIDHSQDLGLRMMRQPDHKQMDYYYGKLLGNDWQQQLEQDFVDAVAEVDAGYITDEMVRERRGLQAAIMRRLEVEEWDKERMRHFYYGLYGLGPWYWDMEERLHNPFFIGARGWNGPPESWINENKIYPNDMRPASRDFRLAAAEALEPRYGKEVVGKRLKVFMPKDNRWRTGTVKAYHGGYYRHMVVFDDDIEAMNCHLYGEEYQFLPDSNAEQAGNDLLGQHISVMLPDEKRWFRGLVVGYDGLKHTVMFDDGDTDHVLLEKGHYKLAESGTSSGQAAGGAQAAGPAGLGADEALGVVGAGLGAAAAASGSAQQHNPALLHAVHWNVQQLLAQAEQQWMDINRLHTQRDLALVERDAAQHQVKQLQDDKAAMSQQVEMMERELYQLTAQVNVERGLVSNVALDAASLRAGAELNNCHFSQQEGRRAGRPSRKADKPNNSCSPQDSPTHRSALAEPAAAGSEQPGLGKKRTRASMRASSGAEAIRQPAAVGGEAVGGSEAPGGHGAGEEAAAAAGTREEDYQEAAAAAAGRPTRRLRASKTADA